MPGKMARSGPRPPFGLREVTVVVRTSLLSCRKARNTRIFMSDRKPCGESRFMMPNLRSMLIRFSLFFVFVYFATETQIAIAQSDLAIARSRPYRILADLPQRRVPSWCKHLRHPNINVCGSIQYEEQTIETRTLAKPQGHAAVLNASLPYLNANGWTVFTPATGTGSCGNSSSNYTGTCVVFVAAAGNDSTCAAQLPNVTSPSAGRACATIARGISLLRPGASADWLLLNRGDTFQKQDFSSLCARGGTSAMTPLLISAYGSGARPIVEPNPSRRWAIGSMGGGGCGAGGNNIAIVGIEFYAYMRDPGNASYNSTLPDINGTQFLNPITWMLIEDCKFSFFSIDIDVDGSLNASNDSNVSIRRNVIVDAYATDEHSQGLYVNSVNNLLIQENLFDHNGWNATVTGAGPTIFNHNMYLTAQNGPVTVIGNISSNELSGQPVPQRWNLHEQLLHPRSIRAQYWAAVRWGSDAREQQRPHRADGQHC